MDALPQLDAVVLERLFGNAKYFGDLVLGKVGNGGFTVCISDKHAGEQ